jgi:hypothetical protein
MWLHQSQSQNNIHHPALGTTKPTTKKKEKEKTTIIKD